MQLGKVMCVCVCFYECVFVLMGGRVWEGGHGITGGSLLILFVLFLLPYVVARGTQNVNKPQKCRARGRSNEEDVFPKGMGGVRLHIAGRGDAVQMRLGLEICGKEFKRKLNHLSYTHLGGSFFVKIVIF